MNMFRKIMGVGVRMPKIRLRGKQAAAALGVLVALSLLGGCGHSRQEVLDALHVELPPCEPKVHSFDYEDGWWPPGSLQTHYTAPKACVDDYLRGYGVDLEHPVDNWPGERWSVGGRHHEPGDPPFADSQMKQFRLKLDPSRTYPIHSFKTPYGSEFRVLLDEQGDTTRVYMDTRFGGPHML